MIQVPGLDDTLLVHVVECVALVQTDRANEKSVEGAEGHAVDRDIVLLLEAVINCSGSGRSCIPESQHTVVPDAAHYRLAEYRVLQFRQYLLVVKISYASC